MEEEIYAVYLASFSACKPEVDLDASLAHAVAAAFGVRDAKGGDGACICTMQALVDCVRHCLGDERFGVISGEVRKRRQEANGKACKVNMLPMEWQELARALAEVALGRHAGRVPSKSRDRLKSAIVRLRDVGGRPPVEPEFSTDEEIATALAALNTKGE